MPDEREDTSELPGTQPNGPVPPWSKLWHAEWSADLRLRACSLAEVGAFFRLYCLMHQGAGRLTAPLDQVAGLLGVPERELQQAVKKLCAIGLLAMSAGVLTCPALARQLERREVYANNGRRRGVRRPKKATGASRKATLAEANLLSKISGSGSGSISVSTEGIGEGQGEAKGRPKKVAAHVPVVEMFQRAWADYRHGVAVRPDTPVTEIPREALYLPTTADWKAAADLLRFAAGNLDVVRARMRNAFESESLWVKQHLSPRLIAAHWNQFEGKIHDFSNGRANGHS